MASTNGQCEPGAALKNSRLAIIIAAVSGLSALAAIMLPIGPNVTELRRVSEEARKLAAGQAEVSRVALALAATQLQTAVNDGAPYQAELSLVDRLGAGQDLASELKILTPHAGRGVATQAQLVVDFDALAAETLTRETGAWAPGWMSGAVNAIASATVGLVMKASVTPPGAASSPVLRAMRSVLVNGDYTNTLAASEALPDSAKPGFEAWRKATQARLESMAAAQSIVAKTSIGGKK